MIFSGNNTYNGTTVINAGTLQIGAGGATGALSASSAITNNGTLSFNRTDTVTQGTQFASVIGGTGNLTQAGTGTLTLSGNNTYTGATTINAGTLEISSTGLLGGGSYAANISNNGTFLFGSNSNQTLSGNITGTGSLTKNGTGVLTLSGANTYNGTTTINAGTLKAGSTNGMSSASTLTVNAGVFDLNGFNATVAAVGAGAAAGTITNSASGSGTNTLTLTNLNVAFAPLITDGATAKTAVVMSPGGQNTPSFANANNTFSGGLTIGGGSSTRLWQGSVTNTLVNGTLTKSTFGTGTVYIGANGSTGVAQLMLNSGSVYNNIVVNAAATYADGGRAAFRIEGSGIQLYGTPTASASDISLSSGGTGTATAYGQLTGTNGLLLNTPATAFTLTLANTANAANN